MASGYASGEADTSLHHDMDWASLWTIGGAKGLRKAWTALPGPERARIRDAGWQVADLDTGDHWRLDPDEALVSRDHWERSLREHGGNGLLALWDIWYAGGTLVGDERAFSQILRGLGGSHAHRLRAPTRHLRGNRPGLPVHPQPARHHEHPGAGHSGFRVRRLSCRCSTFNPLVSQADKPEAGYRSTRRR